MSGEDSLDDSHTDEQDGSAWAKWVIPITLLCALGCGLAGLYCLGLTFHVVLWAGVLWGLALYVTGVLAGFVFGIPRVIDRDNLQRPAQGSAVGAAGSDGAGNAERALTDRSDGSRGRAKSSINSNLVEISDWLTKIIIGVGLVELKQLPRYGESLAGFIAQSLVPVDSQSNIVLSKASVSLSGAIALYFGVLGFITGYLLTRIFLSVIMSLADRDADSIGGHVQLASGGTAPLKGVVAELRQALEDAQTKLAEAFTRKDVIYTPPVSNDFDPFAQSGAPAGSGPSHESYGSVDSGGDSGTSGDVDISYSAPEPAWDQDSAPIRSFPQAGAPTPDAGWGTSAWRPREIRRALWVDDHPERIALFVDRVRQADFVVDQVNSSKQALAHLTNREYALVITDLYRRTEADPGQAGVRLIRAIREKEASLIASPEHVPIQIIVYSSRKSLEQQKTQVLRAGADFVTNSQIELLAYLTRLLGPI